MLQPKKRSRFEMAWWSATPSVAFPCQIEITPHRRALLGPGSLSIGVVHRWRCGLPEDPVWAQQDWNPLLHGRLQETRGRDGGKSVGSSKTAKPQLKVTPAASLPSPFWAVCARSLPRTPPSQGMSVCADDICGDARAAGPWQPWHFPRAWVSLCRSESAKRYRRGLGVRYPVPAN